MKVIYCSAGEVSTIYTHLRSLQFNVLHTALQDLHVSLNKGIVNLSFC